MSRLPVVAFATLVTATIAAFFVTQHLKVTTPVINGSITPPKPFSPGRGGCMRTTLTSFYLQHRSDDVDVYVVDQGGTIVRAIALNHHMRKGNRLQDGIFVWNGREDDGRLAPDGTYHFRVGLRNQGRTIDIKSPIILKTVAPRPVVTRVDPSLLPQGGRPATIHYAGNEGRAGTVRIYRTDLPGPPQLVRSFSTPEKGEQASWDGRIGGRPAAGGTYLVGLQVTDRACNTGRFPPQIPPTPGSTPHAGITVRYLAAQPPLDPVPAGETAHVYVDSRQRPYAWALRHAGGGRATLAHGAGSRFDLRVALPRGAAGLYELALASGSHRTEVPLVARLARPARGGSILVVLPALTWQGLNPVDDDFDGLPDTLDTGAAINLARPLAAGLPPGFPDQAALLAYLDRAHLAYDLTTDMGLLDGAGPSLAAHRGVVLAGDERWLPSSLAGALRSYAQHGGRILSLGADSLRRGVTVQGAVGAQRALNPTAPAPSDALGARLGAAVTHNHELISQIRDDLGIFRGTSGALPGFSSFRPVVATVPPAGPIASAAGTSSATASVVGYRLGRGIVVEVGLPGFGSSLARDVDAQELTRRLWTILSH